MGVKYQFIQDALNNQKLKMNLSIISESENENNKSYSKVGTPDKNLVSFKNNNFKYSILERQLVKNLDF